MSTAPVLRDIHVPGEPSWWPPAPGWWLLGLVLIAIIVYLATIWLRARRLHRARAELLQEFEAVRRIHPSNTEAAAQIAALSMLLRRASKHYAPQALTLRDQPWLHYLDADDPSRPFSAGVGQLLLDAPYRAHVEPHQADELAALIRSRLPRFVARHRHA
jgi:hypothetical protein